MSHICLWRIIKSTFIVSLLLRLITNSYFLRYFILHGLLLAWPIALCFQALYLHHSFVLLTLFHFYFINIISLMLPIFIRVWISLFFIILIFSLFFISISITFMITDLFILLNLLNNFYCQPFFIISSFFTAKNFIEP